MRRKLLLGIIGLIVFINAGILVVSLSNNEFAHINSLKEKDLFRILDTECVPREDVTSFCVSDGAIMLYYDESGLTNVYSLDGAFLYGLQTATSQNGHGNIKYHNGYLYIMSRPNRIYIFDKTELVDTFLPSDDWTEFLRIEEMMRSNAQHSLDGETYYYLENVNKIAKTSISGEMTDIIVLPEMDSNDGTAFVLLLISLCCFVELAIQHKLQ